MDKPKIDDNSTAEVEPQETLDQEIDRLAEHFPNIAALLRRALKFFR